MFEHLITLEVLPDWSANRAIAEFIINAHNEHQMLNKTKHDVIVDWRQDLIIIRDKGLGLRYKHFRN